MSDRANDLEKVDTGGRPPKMTSDVTEKILGALRSQQRLDVAAGIAGVGRTTLYTWLRAGATAKDRLAAGDKRADLTAQERRCLDFVDAVSGAVAIAEASAVHNIHVAGTRPSVETKTTRRYVGLDDNDQPRYVEEVTSVSKPPDWRANAFYLERRIPAYQSRTRLEVTGEEGRPIEIEFAAKLALLDSKIRGGQDAISAESRELEK